MDQLLFLNDEKECALDSKGRVRLPSSLMAQLGEEHDSVFILKQNKRKGILHVYPKVIWEDRLKRYSQINSDITANEEFLRRNLVGAVWVEKDSSGRIQIPKHVVKSLGFSENVMVVAYMGKIEIWQPDQYYQYLEDDSYDEDAESRRIFGDSKKGD